MAKTKITISLIKNGIAKKDILKEGVSSLWLRDGNKLYYKRNAERKPDWLESFFGEDAPNNRSLLSKSVSAVLLYEVEVEEGIERSFAITFGFGRTLINSNVLEERFGLLSALNSIDSSKLRSIDTNTLDTNPLSSRIQASNLAGVGVFNIDKERELLKSITGKADTEWCESSMTGSVSLSLSTEYTYKNIKPFLINCYRQFKSENYQKHFKWVDQMRQITDGNLIRTLDEKMLDVLNSAEHLNMCFSVPEIIDWKDADGLVIADSDKYDDVDIDILKTLFSRGFKRTTIRTNHLSLVDENGNRKQAWPLYKCISVDLVHEDQRYLLNDGVWYRLHNGFVEEVNEFYNNTDITKKLELSDYSINSEGTYNRQEAEIQSEYLCLFDCKLERIDGDPIEPCDLYSKDRQFIHVKHFSGSSVLSHLFNQGLVSAESIFEKSFRAKVREKLKDGFELAGDDDFRASDYEIVYVIAKKDAKRNKLPDIPFFSKVAFRNVAKRLYMYGYKVSILGIPYTYVVQERME